MPLQALAMPPGKADFTKLISRFSPAAASRTRLGWLERISPYPHQGSGEVLVGTSAPQPSFPPQNEQRVDPQGLQGGVSEHAAPHGALLPQDSPQRFPSLAQGEDVCHRLERNTFVGAPCSNIGSTSLFVL